MEKIINMAEAKELINSGKVVVIDFFATWCGPCQMYKPVFGEVAQEMTDVEMALIDIDQDIDFAGENGVMGVPTTIIFKDGKEVARFDGFKPAEELKAFINENK